MHWFSATTVFALFIAILYGIHAGGVKFSLGVAAGIAIIVAAHYCLTGEWWGEET